MPLVPPSLDDRTFDDLRRDAVALIPRHFPEWTDYNPSDPGITLIELFAHLIEAAIYQLDRVPERSLEHFAALVGVTRNAGEPIEDTLRRAYEAVRARERAVTAEDFENLVLSEYGDEVARVHAAVRQVESGLFPDATVIEVAVLPEADDSASESAPDLPLPDRIFAFLDRRRLITTRVRVERPSYRTVVVETELEATAEVLAPATLRGRAETAIGIFLDPRTGGSDGTGWPFGRPLYRSELFQLLEGLDGVDHVVALRLGTDQTAPTEIDRIDALSPTSLLRLGALDVAIRTL